MLRGDIDIAVVGDVRRALEDSIERALSSVTVDLAAVTHLDRVMHLSETADPGETASTGGEPAATT